MSVHEVCNTIHTYQELHDCNTCTGDTDAHKYIMTVYIDQRCINVGPYAAIILVCTTGTGTSTACNSKLMISVVTKWAWLPPIKREFALALNAHTCTKGDTGGFTGSVHDRVHTGLHMCTQLRLSDTIRVVEIFFELLTKIELFIPLISQ